MPTASLSSDKTAYKVGDPIKFAAGITGLDPGAPDEVATQAGRVIFELSDGTTITADSAGFTVTKPGRTPQTVDAVSVKVGTRTAAVQPDGTFVLVAQL